MKQTLLPSFLASLGYVMVLLAVSLPFFNWQVKETITDFPPSYEIQATAIPLTTRLGKPLGDGLFRGKIIITNDGIPCRYQNVNITVRQVEYNKSSDRIQEIFSEENIVKLEEVIGMVIVLSGIYIWWFAIWHRHSFWEGVGLTILAISIFILLTQITRPFLWGTGDFLKQVGDIDCFRGSITFGVRLLKIHYGILILLIGGVILEIGAVGLMLHYAIAIINNHNESHSG